MFLFSIEDLNMYQQNGASCWGAARWTLCASACVLLAFFLLSSNGSQTVSEPGVVAAQ
jgi:hypothetical protein